MWFGATYTRGFTVDHTWCIYITACHLFDDKLSYQPTLVFHSQLYTWKCHLTKSQPFCFHLDVLIWSPAWLWHRTYAICKHITVTCGPNVSDVIQQMADTGSYRACLTQVSQCSGKPSHQWQCSFHLKAALPLVSRLAGIEIWFYMRNEYKYTQKDCIYSFKAAVSCIIMNSYELHIQCSTYTIAKQAGASETASQTSGFDTFFIYRSKLYKACLKKSNCKLEWIESYSSSQNFISTLFQEATADVTVVHRELILKNYWVKVKYHLNKAGHHRLTLHETLL